MLYSHAYVRSLFQRNPMEWSQEEIIDMTIAINQLRPLDKSFVTALLSGHSLRSAGREIQHPSHTSGRFKRICRELSRHLERE